MINNRFIHLLSTSVQRFLLQQVFIHLMSIKEHVTVREKRDFIKNAYSYDYIHNTFLSNNSLHNVFKKKYFILHFPNVLFMMVIIKRLNINRQC